MHSCARPNDPGGKEPEQEDTTEDRCATPAPLAERQGVTQGGDKKNVVVDQVLEEQETGHA